MTLDFDGSGRGFLQSEQLVMALADRLGLPNQYRRFVELYINGVSRKLESIVYEDSQQPNSDFLEEWFPDQSAGQLFAIQVWWQGADLNSTFQNLAFTNASLERFSRVLPGGATNLDMPRYRLSWVPKALRGSADDFDALTNLILAVETTNSLSYFTNVENQIDSEEWMRVLAFERAVGNYDSYGWSNGQNMFGYHHLTNGLKWNFLMTDFDIVFTDTRGPTEDPLAAEFEEREPRLRDMRNIPVFRRAFWRCLYDLANTNDGVMLTNVVSPIYSGNQAVLLANNCETSDTSADWIAARQDYLWGRLAEVRPSFAFLTTNNVHSATNVITLTGVAPVEVKGIKLNGNIANVNWTTVTNWSITTTLANGSNFLQAVGYDRKTNALPIRDVGGYTNAISVHYP